MVDGLQQIPRQADDVDRAKLSHECVMKLDVKFIISKFSCSSLLASFGAESAEGDQPGVAPRCSGPLDCVAP